MAAEVLNIAEFRAMAFVMSSGGDEVLDDGLAGGGVEGVGGPEAEGQEDDVPGPDRAGEDQGGGDEGHEHIAVWVMIISRRRETRSATTPAVRA